MPWQAEMQIFFSFLSCYGSVFSLVPAFPGCDLWNANLPLTHRFHLACWDSTKKLWWARKDVEDGPRSQKFELIRDFVQNRWGWVEHFWCRVEAVAPSVVQRISYSDAGQITAVVVPFGLLGIWAFFILCVSWGLPWRCRTKNGRKKRCLEQTMFVHSVCEQYF